MHGNTHSHFFPDVSDLDIGLVIDADLVGSPPLRTSSASVAGDEGERRAAAESALARSAAK